MKGEIRTSNSEQSDFVFSGERGQRAGVVSPAVPPPESPVLPGRK